MTVHDDETPDCARELGPTIAPLERFVAPPQLTGEQGTRRFAVSECRIAAQNDRDAILAWLADVAASDASYETHRNAAEKLLNWACFERGVAMSSLEQDDLLVFLSFLNAPSPSPRWICQRATRRTSDAWRPFQSALSAASQYLVLSSIASLFGWLRKKRYAHLPQVSDLRSLRMGFGRQSTCATRDRCHAGEPLSQAAWSWVEKRLADPTDPPTLETRLVLELLYFAGMKLIDVRRLNESHCIAPTPNFPAWRLYVADRAYENPWVYALPPLARSLEEWFGPRASMLRPTSKSLLAGVWEGVSIFARCNTLFARISVLLKEAARAAALHGDEMAGRELVAATPFALRHAIEIHGAHDAAFARGFIAHSSLKGGTVIRYVQRVPITRLFILHGWFRLWHLWSTYPMRVADTQQRREGKGCGPRNSTVAEGEPASPKAEQKWRQVTITSGAAIDAYRSMDRYIRRHIAPRCNATLVDWIHRADPRRISSSIRDDVNDRTAWSYLLWAFTVEPTIRRRRWRFEYPFWTVTDRKVQLTIPIPESLWPRGQQATLIDQVVIKHTGDALKTIWHGACHNARAACAAGHVSWGPGTVQVRLNARGESFDDAEVPHADRLVPSARTSKEARSLAYAQAEAHRRQLLANACEGPCLNYEGCAGWSVVSGSQADCLVGCDDMRRTRLLGVKGRPAVVLYEQDGRYVLRMVTVSLQVAARTPKEGFTQLREACRRYEARYGSRWIAEDRRAVLTRIDHRDIRDIHLDSQIQMLAKRGKFWANGPEIAAVWALHHR